MTETASRSTAKEEASQLPTSNGAPSPLRTLCAELHEQVMAFLQEDVQTETLRNVQCQCWHTITIISDALENYPYLHIFLQPLTSPAETDLQTRHPLPLLQRRQRLPRPPDPLPRRDTRSLHPPHHIHIDLQAHTINSTCSTTSLPYAPPFNLHHPTQPLPPS